MHHHSVNENRLTKNGGNSSSLSPSQAFLRLTFLPFVPVARLSPAFLTHPALPIALDVVIAPLNLFGYPQYESCTFKVTLRLASPLSHVAITHGCFFSSSGQISARRPKNVRFSPGISCVLRRMLRRVMLRFMQSRAGSDSPAGRLRSAVRCCYVARHAYAIL